MNTFTTFRLIFEAALIAVALSPLACWLARKFGLVDIPNSEPHKQHTGPMPVAGGVILFVTVIVVGLAEQSIEALSIRPILLAATITFLFGLWDDYKGLSPLVKLVGQVLAALLLIKLGVHVRLFVQDWPNWILTVLWVVGVTNAYNFVDSMDGLADGLAGLAFAFFMLATIDSQQYYLSLFSTILLGACIGSFYFNSSPARYFIGDSGSQFLGFILAAIGIAYNPVGFSRFASWYVPILLMGVPLFDATLVIISRLLRGRPIYKAA
ncbi:MAG TPA: MraY family glycosyltransferase, partial [Anaerolineales bacterium]